jgi:hypothetical protein
MIVMFRAILSMWRAHQRRIDIEILWPICKREAAAKFGDEQMFNYARGAFAVHAFNDPAWVNALTHDEIVEQIEALE